MSQSKIEAALRVAIGNMVGLIPAVAVQSSTPGVAAVFTTSVPHKLVTGVCATLSGHSTINGSYEVETVSATQFKLRDLSDQSIYVSTSKSGSGGVIKADLVEWENTSFRPIVGVPYQAIHILFAKPENPSFGLNHVRESGFMQITLHYPKKIGTGDAGERVDLIKQVFKLNTTLEFDGIKVIVTETPEKMGGAPLEQSYAVAVRVPFRCDIYS